MSLGHEVMMGSGRSKSDGITSQKEDSALFGTFERAAFANSFCYA
jgi:hypothetical protein